MVRHMVSQLHLLNQSAAESDPDWTGPASDMDWSAATGEVADLEQIYRQYLDPVYRFLYGRVGNRQDAEDLTSETFLKASRHIDVNRPPASIASWLFTVARTVLADHWRQYYRYGALMPVDVLSDNLMSEAKPPAAQQSQTECWLAASLAALPLRYRQVLELRFLQGYSILETAHELGLTPGNVKVIQHRALARLSQSGEPLVCRR